MKELVQYQSGAWYGRSHLDIRLRVCENPGNCNCGVIYVMGLTRQAERY
jgi:hypothetical protein